MAENASNGYIFNTVKMHVNVDYIFGTLPCPAKNWKDPASTDTKCYILYMSIIQVYKYRYIIIVIFEHIFRGFV